ncbi:TNT antitoxin family protein [Mycobacterium nebraskense]|uniref:TNT antitoxin family protein n=1 Tax=Mycobacterium nebraskense TaxID=244292 RepID=UPI0009E280EA|nr:TNT antitoxin family protein [Mycobacterium nebraskense]MBI2695941.1 TNT antitoxin family protein [Mycobacterium nebraskense]MCV7119957.1 TNT antitoxin family protein [Mycobacterium nebraskense]
MTDSSIGISTRLEQWAELAGYTLTPGKCTDDGRALFWAALGEIRLFIGKSQDGWFVVTDSDRMGPEHFILAAPSMDTIEKYLFGRFCLHIRSARGLPRVGVPASHNGLLSPYSIETRDFQGTQRFALIASDGSTVAVSSADRVTATAELRKLALYLTATIDQIEASADDPDGKPLFEPR